MKIANKRKARIIMKQLTKRVLSVGLAVAVGVILTGCDAPKHKMVETPPGKKTICRMCYDEIVKVPPHPRYGPMGGVRRVHKCTGCNSDATYYDENGVLKIRCAGCAPEGMDCDKCLPRD